MEPVEQEEEWTGTPPELHLVILPSKEGNRHSETVLPRSFPFALRELVISSASQRNPEDITQVSRVPSYKASLHVKEISHSYLLCLQTRTEPISTASCLSVIKGSCPSQRIYFCGFSFTSRGASSVNTGHIHKSLSLSLTLSFKEIFYPLSD